MKATYKYLPAFVFSLATFLVISSSIYAQATFTRVRGNVYDLINGGGIGGKTVNIVCNGTARTAGTDSSGLYFADFALAECDKFQQVSASVTHNGETQSQTVFVSDNNRATLDFYFGAAAVPEFGMVTGIVAAAGSAIAYFGMKRKMA